jgi:hypothetical protein
MCLLITQHNNSARLSDVWLEDFYDYNSDGVGVMYAHNDQLVIEKVLPKNAHQFVAFYREHIEGKPCAFHLRMRTHGAIDLDNCHPYEVLNRAEHGLDLWLMHNGVLSTGNARDLTKSDTWHYIRDFLRPMLANNPDYAFSDSFAQIVGTHIGASNKFVLMDNQGRMTTINRDSGVFWAGLWLSNTYAWSASKNTSKKPVKSLKTIRKHAKEKPTRALNYGYGYGRTNIGYLDSYPSYYEDEDGYADQLEYEVWNIVEELNANGYEDASSVAYYDLMDFVETYGLDALQEVAYMVMDGNINQEWFTKIIQKNKTAIESFPFLKPKVKEYDYAK